MFQMFPNGKNKSLKKFRKYIILKYYIISASVFFKEHFPSAPVKYSLRKARQQYWKLLEISSGIRLTSATFNRLVVCNINTGN